MFVCLFWFKEGGPLFSVEMSQLAVLILEILDSLGEVVVLGPVLEQGSNFALLDLKLAQDLEMQTLEVLVDLVAEPLEGLVDDISDEGF